MPDGPDAGPEASDTELLCRILAGDKDLFEILVRRYDRRLFRVARAVLHTDPEAEDVVQESFVRAFEHLRDFEGRGLFSTWLTRIALREALSRKRDRRRRADAELAQARESGATAAAPASERKVLQHEVRDLLESAIRKMPEPYRLVFMMRHIEEMSTAATASCLGITEQTVKVRLVRARSFLRDLLPELVNGAGDAFLFLGAQCDRVTAAVRERILARAQ